MNQIDFLPDRIRRQRGRQASLKRQGLMLAVCIAAMALLTWANHGQLAEARASMRSTEYSRLTVRDQLGMIPDLSAQIADGEVKARISRELGSRLEINAVLAELCRLMPASAGLTELEYSTVEMQSPSASQAARRGMKAPTICRVKLIIRGLAPTDVDVANFLGQVSACPLFEDVQMGYTRTVEIDKKTRKARSFEVTCLLAQ